LDLFTSDEHGHIRIERGEDERVIAAALNAYSAALRAESLCTLSFTTLHEYLWLLRALILPLRAFGSRAMLYSAAAVSDFYLTPERVAQDKIQSAEGALTLRLSNVPKVVPVIKTWAPELYLVTFKLETDPKMLSPKMKGHLTRYNVDVVVGNMLHDRDQRIAIGTQWSETTIERSDPSEEIENQLVSQIVSLHAKSLARANGS
jgi:phosphopantothenate-cysteine ligase